MLVLTRKSNQSIMIGDDIEISVLAIMGEKVRIGIEAPRSVPVFRREVYVEIQEDQDAGEERRTWIEPSKGSSPTPARARQRGLAAGEHRQRLEHHDRDDHGRHDDVSARKAKRNEPCLRVRSTRRTRER